MHVDLLPPPRPSRPLPSARRSPAAGQAAVIFLLPWDGTHGAAHDAARAAPRLAAPAIAPETQARPRPAAPAPAWVHQALTPLPTDGFLALRAATSAYRQFS